MQPVEPNTGDPKSPQLPEKNSQYDASLYGVATNTRCSSLDASAPPDIIHDSSGFLTWSEIFWQ